MYDIHNHVLPGVDDGAPNVRVSLQMLEQAVEQGITHVACTPHLYERFDATTDRRYESVFLDLIEQVLLAGLPVELMLGSEIMLRSDLKQVLSYKAATYAGREKYFLLEFPRETPHDIVLNSVRAAARWQLIPVLAHIERYTTAVKVREHAQALRDAGAVLTIDGGALLGQFGAALVPRAEKLVSEGFVDIMASDAHGVDKDKFCMKAAYEAAAGLVGADAAKKMVVDHPRRVWSHEPWPEFQVA